MKKILLLSFCLMISIVSQAQVLELGIYIAASILENKLSNLGNGYYRDKKYIKPVIIGSDTLYCKRTNHKKAKYQTVVFIENGLDTLRKNVNTADIYDLDNLIYDINSKLSRLQSYDPKYNTVPYEDELKYYVKMKKNREQMAIEKQRKRVDSVRTARIREQEYRAEQQRIEDSIRTASIEAENNAYRRKIAEEDSLQEINERKEAMRLDSLEQRKERLEQEKDDIFYVNVTKCYLFSKPSDKSEKLLRFFRGHQVYAIRKPAVGNYVQVYMFDAFLYGKRRDVVVGYVYKNALVAVEQDISWPEDRSNLKRGYEPMQPIDCGGRSNKKTSPAYFKEVVKKNGQTIKYTESRPMW